MSGNIRKFDFPGFADMKTFWKYPQIWFSRFCGYKNFLKLSANFIFPVLRIWRLSENIRKFDFPGFVDMKTFWKYPQI